jgi:hypothetical protein
VTSGLLIPAQGQYNQRQGPLVHLARPPSSEAFMDKTERWEEASEAHGGCGTGCRVLARRDSGRTQVHTRSEQLCDPCLIGQPAAQNQAGPSARVCRTHRCVLLQSWVSAGKIAGHRRAWPPECPERPPEMGGRRGSWCCSKGMPRKIPWALLRQVVEWPEDRGPGEDSGWEGGASREGVRTGW